MFLIALKIHSNAYSDSHCNQVKLMICDSKGLQDLTYLKVWWNSSIFPFVYMVWIHNSAQQAYFFFVKLFSKGLFTKYILTDENNFLEFHFTCWTSIIHIETLSFAGSNSRTWSCWKFCKTHLKVLMSKKKKKPKVFNEVEVEQSHQYSKTLVSYIPKLLMTNEETNQTGMGTKIG